jgi:hypothetical protein
MEMHNRQPRPIDLSVPIALLIAAGLLVVWFARPYVASFLAQTAPAPTIVLPATVQPRPQPAYQAAPYAPAQPVPEEAPPLMAPIEAPAPVALPPPAPPANLDNPVEVEQLGTYADQATGGGWQDAATGAVLPFDPTDQEAVDTMNRALANSGQPTMTPGLSADTERAIACAADLAAGGAGC